MSRITSPIPIMLDKERHLRLDFNAACEVENVCGVNPYMDDFWKDFGPAKARAVLWGMLLHESPKIRIEKVGDLIQQNMHRFQEITNAIFEAYKASQTGGKDQASDGLSEKEGE